MTNDQITQWALEAGIYLDGENQRKPLYVSTKEELQAFATPVRNATIEECAAKCDAWGDSSSVTYIGSSTKVAAQRLREMKE